MSSLVFFVNSEARTLAQSLAGQPPSSLEVTGLFLSTQIPPPSPGYFGKVGKACQAPEFFGAIVLHMPGNLSKSHDGFPGRGECFPFFWRRDPDSKACRKMRSGEAVSGSFLLADPPSQQFLPPPSPGRTHGPFHLAQGPATLWVVGWGVDHPPHPFPHFGGGGASF